MYKLLIVDDEAIERKAIRYLVETIKTDIGEIFEAANGLEAVKLALTEKPEICIIDIKMPGMNGHEAARQILSINKETKVIFSTAFSYVDYVVKALQIGAIDFLIKPVNKDTLYKVLHKAIDLLYENEMLQKQKEYFEKIEYVLEKRISHDLVNSLIDEEMIWFLDSKGITPEASGRIIFFTVSRVILDKLSYKLENQIKKELSNTGIKCICTFNNQKLIIIIFASNIGNRIENTISLVVKEVLKNHNLEVVQLSGVNFEDLYQIESILSDGRDHSRISGERIEGSKSDELSNNFSTIINSSREIETICDYIKEHFAEQLSLDSIVENIGYSKFHVSRLFKQYKGCSIIEYLIQIRIERAKELLMQNEYSVKEICYMIGYSDPNYFSWAFKKKVGMSPVKYRYFNESVE